MIEVEGSREFTLTNVLPSINCPNTLNRSITYESKTKEDDELCRWQGLGIANLDTEDSI
jgi:hypothetical protein